MTIFKDKQLTRTYRDGAGDYAVPNVLRPMDLVFRPDLRTKTVHTIHTHSCESDNKCRLAALVFEWSDTLVVFQSYNYL